MVCAVDTSQRKTARSPPEEAKVALEAETDNDKTS